MSDSDKIFDPLSPQDAAAVDAILDRNSDGGGGGDGADGPPSPERKARVESWLNVLGKAPVPTAPADLLARTLAAVKDAPLPFPSQKPAASAAESAAPPGRWRRRMAEIGAMAIAAVMLVAVTLQGLGQVERSHARVARKVNLAKLAIAFGDYGQYCEGELPAMALPANGNWLHGNTPLAAKNNSANLIPMVNHNFAPAYAFYCPGAGVKAPPPGAPLINELPPITYSYRNLYGAQQVRWDGRHDSIILTDKNPLFVPDARVTSDGRLVDSVNSTNHDGHGQYALRADGSVTWEVHPNVGPDHDNIWTVGEGTGRMLTYSGTEYPASLADVFVAP